MSLSKKFSTALLSLTMMLLLCFAPTQQAQAHQIATDATTVLAPNGEAKIKIKIVIIIIIKKKGVAEVQGFYEAGDLNALKSNQILADAYVEGGKFFIMPLKGEAMKSLLILPKNIKMSKSVSLKLGSKKPLGLKAGKIDFRTSKMGNFDIQD